MASSAKGKGKKKLCERSTNQRVMSRCLSFARGGRPQHPPRCRPRAPEDWREVESKQNAKVLSIRNAPTILIYRSCWAPFEARIARDNWKPQKINMPFGIWIKLFSIFLLTLGMSTCGKHKSNMLQPTVDWEMTDMKSADCEQNDVSMSRTCCCCLFLFICCSFVWYL